MIKIKEGIPMNNYDQYPENDYRYYLQHDTKGKHWQWPDHKYIAKTIEGAYIYTKEQLNAARKRGVALVTNATSTVKNTVKDVKNIAEAAKSSGVKGAYTYVKQKHEIRKLINNNIGSSDNAASDSKKLSRQRANREKAAQKAAEKEAKALAKKQKKEKKIREKRYKWSKSFGARLGASLKRVARTVKNLPDVLNQRIKAKKERAEVKSKLPTEKERQAQLEKARRDIQKQISEREKAAKKEQRNKQRSREIYRETGKKVDPKDVDTYDILNGGYLSDLYKSLKKNTSRGSYQPNGGS